MAKRPIRRRVRKNKTIRKVMIGCNRRLRRRHSRTKAGGQPSKIEAAQYATASPGANANIASGTAALLQAQQTAGNIPPEPPKPIQSFFMQGGARTRHHIRRLRYKKSMARKSRHA
jgi:hypothetical protein